MIRSLLLLCPSVALLALDFAPPFQDHVVLQRGKPVPIWGAATPGEPVTLRFSDQEHRAMVDTEGHWRIVLDPLDASRDGRELTVVCGVETLRLSDVLVGDVWLCSGQSNMEFALAPCLGATEDIAAADLPLVRQLKIPWKSSSVPLDRSAHGGWIPCTPKSAGSFSAVGFYFAREISKAIEVPVGIISCNWSGSNIEPWIPPIGYRMVPALQAQATEVDAGDPTTAIGARNHREFLELMRSWILSADSALKAGRYPPPMPSAPGPTDNKTRYYNGMVHPLASFALRGVLWYQGESNGNEGLSYTAKMQALVTGWRTMFRQGDLPFLYVQLANHQKSDPDKPEGGDGWSRLREAQLSSLTIPKTGMAVTIDIGDAADIHPKNKADVGIRLARWALASEYGKQIVPSGPLFRRQTVIGSTISIEFEHAENGLMMAAKQGRMEATPTPDAELRWFSIAGSDKVWHSAKAQIVGNRLVVSSPRVPAPVAVRYAFAMNPAGANLYNSDGLPASPFRTDQW